MIGGLAQLLLFQGLGEILARLLGGAIPGPVMGLLLLFGYLCVRRGANADLELVAAAFSRHLGLLFVPAAVGVVALVAQLRAAWLPITVALIASSAATIAATGFTLALLVRTGRGADEAD